MLGVRGTAIAHQPLVHHSLPGCVFVWNGEVFSTQSIPLSLGENDGVAILAEVGKRAQHTDIRTALVSTLAQVEGPYAFAFLDVRWFAYQYVRGEVVYGRDPLGRRSLLVSHSPFCLVSAASQAVVDAKWVLDEVPCGTLWRAAAPFTDVPTALDRSSLYATRVLLCTAALTGTIDEAEKAAVDAFHTTLSASVYDRVISIRTPATYVALLTQTTSYGCPRRRALLRRCRLYRAGRTGPHAYSPCSAD